VLKLSYRARLEIARNFIAQKKRANGGKYSARKPMRRRTTNRRNAPACFGHKDSFWVMSEILVTTV